MKCPRCQSDNSETSQFCTVCGLLLAGSEIEGASLNSSAPTATSAMPRSWEGEDISPGILLGGKYRILEKLGSGGMGVVYLAEQVEPVRRRVALKLIKLGMDTLEIVARFETERQALAVMDHPNIARVYDAGATESGRPYFVMELARGIPITEYCDLHKLSTQERLRLFIGVCHAVQHAHQKGVIHRDLKPSNILIVIQDDQPVPKIIDFGIAKAVDHRLARHTLFTEQGQLIGTPEYMSPEQAEMSGLDIDTRTDVYSLGVILYELLVGTQPLDAGELALARFGEIQRIIREIDPPKISTRLSTLKDEQREIAAKRGTDPGSLLKQLRGDLDWITMKAMAKDRTRRYSTASELAGDLERYLRHEPVTAGPPSATYRFGKYMQRHKLGVATAAVVILAVLIGTSGVIVGLLRAVRAEKKAIEEAETAKQVSDFLVDLFRISAPNKAKGETITAREILDRGAKKIEQELPGQPSIQARLMVTMGMVYGSLGLYQPAQGMLEKGLQLRRGLYGNKDLNVADTLHQLGIIYDNQGKYEEAASAFQKSLDIRQSQLAPEDPEVAQSLNSLAIVFFNQGNYAKAGPLLEKSLAIKERAEPPDNLDVMNTLINLGVLKQSQRKFGEAEVFFKRALAISEKKLGSDDPDSMATILNNLGSLYESQGRRAEAEPLYLRSLAIWEKILGPDHPDVAIALHNLANLYRDEGKTAKAEPLYLRSLTIWEKALKPDHPYIGIGLREHANMHRDLGNYAVAEPLYIRSLQIFEKNPEENVSEVAETIKNQIILLKKMNRVEEAAGLEKRLEAFQSKH
jgi:eukaryotic-like serine/threonine-protein kinase